MYIFDSEAVNDAVEIVFLADRKKLNDLIQYFKEHAEIGGRLCEEFEEDFNEAIECMEKASIIMDMIRSKI